VANVVVGVTGGIAAYKSAALIRLFTEAGHSVQAVVTTNATRFIGTTTLEALSHNKVQIVDPDLFTDVEGVKHVALAKSADLIVVAPATASFIAKVTAGIADDLLTTTVLTATCPVIIAPAMHTEMWENRATQQNISTLRDRGLLIVDPGVGRLTGDDSGVGRLAEPETILAAASSMLGEKPLNGVRVLVTTGGTRERIDPARFVGNFSSGKQGLAFARAASEMGATVKVIAANVDESLLLGLDHINVVSAKDLEKSVNDSQESFDLLVMAAAVADYSPTVVASEKLKKIDAGDSFEISLTANPDIVGAVSANLRASGSTAVIVAFAAESEQDLEALAKVKLESKKCDFVVANSISSGEVFNSDQNSVVLVSKDSSSSFSGSKIEVARAVLEIVSSKVVRSPRGESK
jgi:phosphopantothenoylcysteine decarboxylase / phosphopantothenate---cysteine ligase